MMPKPSVWLLRSTGSLPSLAIRRNVSGNARGHRRGERDVEPGEVERDAAGDVEQVGGERAAEIDLGVEDAVDAGHRQAADVEGFDACAGGEGAGGDGDGAGDEAGAAERGAVDEDVAAAGRRCRWCCSPAACRR